MSYLLINFYDNRLEAGKSSIKALLVNKFGDIGLLIAIIINYNHLLSFKFSNLNNLSYFIKYESIKIFMITNELYIIGILCGFLLMGVSTKSAQFLFNS
jgi:NADH:ubiquinone oxidoreductase subunit 5 (subunit L)/multisubunit Na+/H+ antiporter MnhA subunit